MVINAMKYDVSRLEQQKIYKHKKLQFMFQLIHGSIIYLLIGGLK